MFSDPKKNLEQAEIHPGMVIADIGAGSGFYALESAKILLSSGKVYVVDIQKDLLTRIKNQADKENISNIEILWGNVETLGGTKLADGSIDLCLFCNILFQLEDKKTSLSEIKRILAPGGRVLLIDWSESFSGMGPHKDSVVTEGEALKMFEQAGFSKEKNIMAGDHHYGMILKKL